MLKFSKTLSLSLLFVAALGLSACNTIAGAGQDIENGGQAIQDAAK